jgi:CIC family chloride channel protein
VFFALEVIIGQFATNTFILTVISSVAASVIGRTFMGDVPAFIVPEYALKSGQELLLYVILGILAGLFGIFYTKVLYKFEDIFDSLKGVHELVKPIFGAFIIGVSAYYVPEILGVGYEFIEGALAGEYLLYTLILLLFAKLIATSITIGSGGSGGVFAPGLYMGAMLGGAFGIIANNLFPNITAQSGAYALVGMGAVFAGSARAPITAILILFELTNDYRIILPLMITVVISTFVANTFYKDSIYTVKLSRRGLKIDNTSTDLMSKISVSEVMIKNVEALNQDAKIRDVLRIMHETGHHGYPIEDLNGDLAGIVTYQDVWQAMQKGLAENEVIEIASKKVVAITKYESLRAALKKMAAGNVGRLPVVDENNDKKMVGFLTRSDILNAYNDKSLKGSS